MPHSRSRHKHSHPAAGAHNHSNGAAKNKTKRSAAVLLAVCMAIMATVVVLLARGFDVVWLAVALIIGSAVGYLLGAQIDKAAK